MNLTPEEALVAIRALYRTPAYHNEATAYAGKYVKAVRIVPDWLIEMTRKTNKWIVLHEGRTHETTATSREDAINNVRYNLYEETPMDALPPFDAINPAYIILDAIGAKRRGIENETQRDLFGKKMISKSDALARLRRMAS